MNTRFLETFLRVASLGSFRAAAQQLNVSQATVSSRISALEVEFNTQLFDREHHEIRLTAAGSLMLEKAQRVLVAESDLRETMNMISIGTGRVRLGLVSSVVHTWLGELIADIAKRFPKLELELTVEPTANLVSQFERGALDVLLTTDEMRAEKISTLPLPPLALGWFTSQALADALPQKPLSLNDIADVPLITFTRNSRPYLSTMDLFNARKLQPPVLHCVTSLAAIVRLTERGLGVATLPCGSDLESAALIRLDIDAQLQDLPMYCVWHQTSDAELYRAICDLAVDCATAHRSRTGT